MYEVYYKCFYRDQWYWDSSHDNPASAILRAQQVATSDGRAMLVTEGESPVWACPQTRMAGPGVPMRAPALAYMD